jgi:hypothetical protein
MKLMSERDLNILRGMAMAGMTTPKDTLAVLDHLALVEMELDKADYDDTFGTEGWRHAFNIPDADED